MKLTLCLIFSLFFSFSALGQSPTADPGENKHNSEKSGDVAAIKVVTNTFRETTTQEQNASSKTRSDGPEIQVEYAEGKNGQNSESEESSSN